MATATITSKGQITLPKTVREHLGLGEGDRVDFVIEEGGAVRVVPLKRSVRELAGIARRPGARPLTIAEMDEVIVEHLAADDARIRRGGRSRG